MDIKALKYFLTVAQEGTITHAAEKLCMAQPPLSRQLQQLEEELGVTLFIRGKRQIQLTEEGWYLKQQAEEILNLVDKTETQLNKIQSYTHGTISMGVTEACGASILSELIGLFHAKYPYVRFNVWCGNGDEINEKLDKNLVDIGIIREPFNTEKYESTFFKAEPWIALLSVSHPLASNSYEKIELHQLANEQLIIPSRLQLQDEINYWFNEIEQERNIFCMYNSLASIIPLVENNIGIAICPDSVRAFTNDQKLVYKKIVNPEHLSNLMVIRKRHQIMPAITSYFWNFIHNYINEFQQTK